METRDQTADDDPVNGDDKSRPNHRPTSKRFHFKGSRSARSSTNAEEDRSHRTRRRHHHSSHSQRKRRRTAEGADDTHPSANEISTSQLAPDVAFRESLWDALGDDEGAAFWEGVYGQPVHTYPNTYQDQETGELERMDEEEYAQFVRRKMWEKSWEGIEAAKEEKKREREREKKKLRDEEQAKTTCGKPAPFGYVFDMEVEESLKRGEQRKEKRRWRVLWEDYLRRWEDLQQLAEERPVPSAEAGQLALRNKIAWPVETGRRNDVKAEEIERFIIKGTQSSAAADECGTAVMKALKAERVRWHPDKMQQRYGFMEVDEDTMATVTAAFQTIDRMWNDRRTK